MTRLDRSTRRDFIRTHHPDRGGDPEVFRRGLERLAAGLDPLADDDLPRVRVTVVKRRRFPLSIPHHVARRVRRARKTRVN